MDLPSAHQVPSMASLDWIKLPLCDTCSKPLTGFKRRKRVCNYCDCATIVDCRGCHARTSLNNLLCVDCHDMEASSLKRKQPHVERKLEFLRRWHHSETHDIMIKTADDHTFYANRLILVSKSPVFRAMLDHDMQEARSGCINLEDVTHDVFGVFLDFLHTAEVSHIDLQKHYAALFALANKYDVDLLRTECEEYMSTLLTADNVLKILEVAWKWDVPSLKEAAFTLLKGTYKAVLESPEYIKLAEKDPALTNQILKAILMRV